MSDTKHHSAPAAGSSGPTEGDGVSYRGIVWFVGLLAITTLACQALMWWLLRVEQGRREANDAPRAAWAGPVMQPPPPPQLITLDSQKDANGQPIMALGEPTNLQRFRDQEDKVLTTYGWMDKNESVVRIPIDRAKALLLEKGLPTRAGK